VKSNTFESDLNHDSRSPLINDPWRRLAAAILGQAARDGKRGDSGACEWLLADGVEFAHLVGIDPETVVTMAKTWSQHPAGSIIVRLVEGP